MIFEYNLVVPANTPALSPIRQDMDLAPGIVHRLEVSFPWGCRDKVLVTINRAAHQVWPTNPDGQLKANGFTISYPVWYELEDAPFKLEAYGWSPGTTYSHTIVIRLGVQRREVLQPPRPEVGLLQRVARFLGMKT